MKPIRSRFMKVAAACALLALAFSGSTLLAASAEYSHYARQDKSKQSAPSDGEQKAMAKIEAAPDIAAKLLAAGELIKKYPKSPLRSKVVSYIAQEVSKIQDGAQRITQLENMLTVFKEPSDADVINPILIDAYVKADRFEEAFRVADTTLNRRPDDIATLTTITQVGVDQAKLKNAKFVQQSKQYGERGIQLIESGKKPDALDDASWSQYQTKWLPQLYQWTGLLGMMAGNSGEAKSRLEKAVSLAPSDPFNHYLLGSIINDEYQKIAEEYQKLSAGPLKDAKRQQAEKKMDEVVEAWAHTVALSEGNAQYQQLYDVALQDIQPYYKYRHGGSSDGLQQLIDKYKKQ
jgi:tetratricopeptide (TPR) repeat protein